MILDSVSDLLPGLLPGGYRGVAFDVPDTRTEVGRRIAEHLFPGHDIAKYDDLGLLPEVVSVEGVILGDDYIARAKALRSAFTRPGPGTLMHPWLGPMQVIVDRPPEITFSSRELRVARFSAFFKRLPGGAPLSSSTAGLVADAAAVLATAARRLVLAPAELTISRVQASAAKRSARIFADAVRDAAAAIPRVRAGAGTGRIVATVSSARAGAPDALESLVSSTGEAMLAAVPALTAPAVVVAPAYSAPETKPGLTALQGLELVVDIASRLTVSSAEAPSAPDRAMLAGAAALVLSEAGPMLGQAAFPTRREATASRSAIAGAAEALEAANAELSETLFASHASAVGRAISDLRTTTIADINEIIGRLPEVVAIVTDRRVDAFQLANHLFGDTPAEIERGYADIVARNRPRHPAAIPAGRIEVAR